MRLALTATLFITFLVASTAGTTIAASISVPGSTATVDPTYYSPVTTDAFDISQGTTIISASPITYAGAEVEHMFGLPGGIMGDVGNTLFADGGPADTVHTVLFSLLSPVTIGSIKLGFSQDGSSTIRGAAAYSLLGLQSPTDSGVILSQATLAPDYVAAYGDGNITVADSFVPFTGRYFRFNVTQRTNYYGPRVQELDGFAVAVPEPSTTAMLLCSAVVGVACAIRRCARSSSGRP